MMMTLGISFEVSHMCVVRLRKDSVYLHSQCCVTKPALEASTPTGSPSSLVVLSRTIPGAHGSGEAIADAFLKHQATPERGKLHRLLAGDDVTFTELALIEWGSVAHLGAASKREQTLRFKSLWPIVAAP